MPGLKIPHIAVIGGGISGLRCADVLLRRGAKVTVFEARDRLGGRLYQSRNGGHLVDMGPNWIHGTGDNPIMKLAEKTRTLLKEPEERQIVFASDGTLKSEKESVELGAEVWAIVVDAFKYSNQHFPHTDPKLSLMDFFKQEVPKRFPSDRRKQYELLNEASSWGFFVGEDIERQSLRCFFLEECLDGENVIVASTYHSILSMIAKTALEKAEIKYDTTITQIEYRKEGKDEDKVVLMTKDKARHEFDEVVVTCPLGWLKRNQNAFSPALPPRLTQAIDNISYGRLEKLYVSFPSAWWMHPATSQSASSTSGALPSNSISAGSEVPMFMHFHHPNYHPDPASSNAANGKWNQDIVSLAHLPSSTAHPTLLFYLYGPCGTYLTSLLASHTPHSPQYDALLSAFAHPFFSRLPGYIDSNSACTPTSYLISQWQQDEFAGYGSYSNFQIGLERGDVDIETMRNAGGLSDAGRGLWFAGEHTSPFVAVGTTTGAYWSGEAVGTRIAERYGLEVMAEDVDDAITVGTAGSQRKEVSVDGMGGASMNGMALHCRDWQ